MMRPLLAVLVMLFHTAGSCGESLWTVHEPLPTPRQEVGVGLLGGKIHVIGGFDGNAQSVNTVERYDPLTDQWERVADLPAPGPLNHVGVAVTGDRLYVVGGLTQSFVGVRSVHVFDGEQWDTVRDMPTARGAMGVTVLDGLIYAAGGFPSSRGRDFAVYDPGTDMWQELDPLSVSRDHLVAVAGAGSVFAISGRNPSGLVDTVEVYHVEEGEWRTGEPIPTARGGIAGVLTDDRIFVFGGEGNPASPTGVFAEVEEFDTRTGLWRSLESMPDPRHGIGAVLFSGRIHIPGGSPVEGFGVTNVNSSFAVPAPASDGDRWGMW